MGSTRWSKVRVPIVHGLNRSRLDDALDHIWDCRLGLILAPAGFGKTTALAQFAAAAGRPVAWYRASGEHDSEEAVLAYVYRALVSALGEIEDGWRTTDDAIQALERLPDTPALLVFDDFQVLARTAAEKVLDILAEDAPPWLSIAVASRTLPRLNTSRLRVAEDLLEITADDLRFRTWEVERLFVDEYGEPLGPEETAELARRTGGWAAGLQLFHLATKGKVPQERRRLLSSLTGRSRIVREYLAQNVIESLPDDLHRFVLDSCVLERLSPEVCDSFLGRDDSAEVLDELERRQLFIMRIEDEGVYRYHEVFRSYLEAALLELIGESKLKERYLRAAALHEEYGADADALRAYCRAGAWSRAACLLGQNRGDALEGVIDLTDQLPPSVIRADPWMMLARARQYRACGRWTEAMSSYREAANAFGSESGRELAIAERQQIAAWVDPATTVPPGGWQSLLRDAVFVGPARSKARAASVRGPQAQLIHGFCDLLAGHLDDAKRQLEEAALNLEASPLLAAGAGLLDALAASLSADEASRVRAEWILDELGRLGVPWLENIGRVVVCLSQGLDRLDEIPTIRQAFEHSGDAWGTSLSLLLEGIGRLRDGRPAADVLERAAAGFESLGGVTLEVWALSALALAAAREGLPRASEFGSRAESLGRSTGAAIPCAWSYLARAIAAGDDDQLMAHARNEARRGSLILPGLDATSRPSANDCSSTDPPPPSVSIRCFGSFEFSIDGVSPALDELRPRARTLLRLLALHKGRPVHREVIVEALWPHVDADTAVRNLQVAVSSLRQVVQPGVGRCSSSLIVRTGEAYSLLIPDGSACDLLRFDERLAAGRSALVNGDMRRAIEAFREVIELHEGELLPEDGPADWVVKERDHYRQAALETAEILTSLLMEKGRLSDAVWASRSALRLDRYHDGMWRTLIEALEGLGSGAAAARARREYGQVLEELGLTVEGL